MSDYNTQGSAGYECIVSPERLSQLLIVLSESDVCSVMSAEAYGEIFDCMKHYQQILPTASELERVKKVNRELGQALVDVIKSKPINNSMIEPREITHAKRVVSKRLSLANNKDNNDG